MELSTQELEALIERAIKQAMKESHTCVFDEVSRVRLRDLSRINSSTLGKLVDAFDNSTNYLWRGVIALAFIGLIILVFIGFAAENGLLSLKRLFIQ